MKVINSIVVLCLGASLMAMSSQPKVELADNSSKIKAAKGKMDMLTSINSNAQTILTKYVSFEKGVDYIGLNKDFELLENTVKMHEMLSLEGRSQNELKAIYINLYNFAMMYHALSYAKKQKIKVSSQKFLDLKMNKLSLWSLPYTVKLAETDLSLDQIEHGLIRNDPKRAKVPSSLKPYVLKTLDARIHASVNCAAVTCPRVRPSVLTGANIDKMLEQNFKDWVNSPYHFAKKSSGKMWANQIVSWYDEDFDAAAKKISSKARAGSYLAKFVDSKTKNSAWIKKHFEENPKMSFWSYSWHYKWQINDQRNQGLIKTF